MNRDSQREAETSEWIDELIADPAYAARRGVVGWVSPSCGQRDPQNPAQRYCQQQLRQPQLKPNDCGAANRQCRPPLSRRSLCVSSWKGEQSVADQLKTADKVRPKSRIDVLSKSDLLAVELAVRVQLGLPIEFRNWLKS